MHAHHPRSLHAGALEWLRWNAHHEFWPDDVSLLDPRIADTRRIHGPRQLTVLHLVALAVRRGGRFVTFDAGIPLSAITGADKRHLLAL